MAKTEFYLAAVLKLDFYDRVKLKPVQTIKDKVSLTVGVLLVLVELCEFNIKKEVDLLCHCDRVAAWWVVWFKEKRTLLKQKDVSSPQRCAQGQHSGLLLEEMCALDLKLKVFFIHVKPEKTCERLEHNLFCHFFPQQFTNLNICWATANLAALVMTHDGAESTILKLQKPIKSNESLAIANALNYNPSQQHCTLIFFTKYLDTASSVCQ